MNKTPNLDKLLEQGCTELMELKDIKVLRAGHRLVLYDSHLDLIVGDYQIRSGVENYDCLRGRGK